MTACDIYGAGLFFSTAAGLARTIGPGDLAPEPGSGGVPVADTMVPLNIFDPLLGVSESGGSLVVETGGLYELSFYTGVQFAPSAPFEVFVMQTAGGMSEPIASTVEPVPAGPILLPRLISRTAEACLDSGTELNLFVRVERTGALRVIPGALLSAKRIGDC